MTLVASIQSVESRPGMLHGHQHNPMMASSQSLVEPRLSTELDGQDKARGRKSRPQPKRENSDSNPTTDRHSSDADGEPSTRKRRRSRRGLDSKFVCPEKDCGKSYSRAEHLYRHQLNHTPKQIYNCDFPDCQRAFVRKDLCNRHRDRHKTGVPQRKDSIFNDPTPPLSIQTSQAKEEPVSPRLPRTFNRNNSIPAASNAQYAYQPQDSSAGPFSPNSIYSPSSASDATHHHKSSFSQRSNSSHSLPGVTDALSRSDFSTQNGNGASMGFGSGQRHASFGAVSGTPLPNDFPRPTPQASMVQYSSHHTPSFPASSTTSFQNQQTYINRRLDQVQISQNNMTASSNYVTHSSFAPLTLPPPEFNPPTSSREGDQSYPVTSSEAPMPGNYSREESNQQSGVDMMILDQMTTPQTMPVFGTEGYSRSPFAMQDDFVAFLFGNTQLDSNSIGHNMDRQQMFANAAEMQNQYQPYYSNDVALGGFFPTTAPVQHPMAVNSLLDTTQPENILSEEKNQELVDLIKERFNETDHAPVARQKEALFDGDRNQDSHMMSTKMMQTYISSFWRYFHPQMPILHKPTFSPDKSPNLLLIAMVAIGASCLDKSYGIEITEAGASLSNFLAWHLRWEIFADVHFRPPAKLWIFQTLLLLEFYEKMYSTRALHERAHIHHATTLTLMRRGSSLIGRSASDSPPSVRDDRGPGSRQSSTSGANTPDEWWNGWITNEATRRAAFAAFIMDSTHATMFGHSTVMVAHEMRLPLPCDESLWSATSGTEVGRLETSMHAKGFKPTSFLEGLKRTLAAQEVHTNPFGRTILMAGLLSVAWHLNQKDLQVNSLGVSTIPGGRDKWKTSLTKAFDFWRRDYDRALLQDQDSKPDPYTYSKQDESVVFESRTVLHHLAHMAMYIDVVDCQIFAHAKRLLGRTIGAQDLRSTQRKMKDAWAPSARARDATFYALRFLGTVLLPTDSQAYTYAPFTYSAREDVLLNRPWVLYYAALIVWCYAYALEGPLAKPFALLSSHEEQVRDMRGYLKCFSSLRSPEDLQRVNGLNGCRGLLIVLQGTFRKTRWELLHEAANLLGNCINLVSGTG